ncbi:MAG TPA: carboxylating nicotinate-nucleotide diphosphorylase [Spirochaetales bacterium]|nr:carboxylating nicotinate-nucleotide diphosphorylase [Spirochaetales bacterium]
MLPPGTRSLIKRALAEDLGRAGDVSSLALFGPADRDRFVLVSKDQGVACGLELFSEVFRALDRRVRVATGLTDGQLLSKGQRVATVEGPVRAILSGERTAINFLSHLSGIATKTAALVSSAGPGAPAVLDTRKTIPGLRALEKYAVATGGGRNHRMGLYDMVMLKDNHIDAAGGIPQAVARARARWGRRFKIEVETRNLDEVQKALDAGADRIMLDNMDDATMREAVALVAGRAETEASGNMTLERYRALADSGIDFVSFGELTHTVRAFDFSLRKDARP